MTDTDDALDPSKIKKIAEAIRTHYVTRQTKTILGVKFDRLRCEKCHQKMSRWRPYWDNNNLGELFIWRQTNRGFPDFCPGPANKMIRLPAPKIGPVTLVVRLPDGSTKNVREEVKHAACSENCPHRYSDKDCVCTAGLY
jgi:hypothetical protein